MECMHSIVNAINKCYKVNKLTTVALLKEMSIK